MISTRKGSNPFAPRMSNYSNKLITKTKLLNFWTFSGINSKSIFLFNHKFTLCFYKKKIFFEHSKCVSVIKSIFPILHSIINSKDKILFVGTTYFYIQSFSFLKSKFISVLTEGGIGSFTNFVTSGFKFFNKKLKKNSSLIFFLNVSINDNLIVESKKKKIPTIGLVNPRFNISLLDYPIFLNSFYFYNVYFFSRLVFKYILKLI